MKLNKKLIEQFKGSESSLLAVTKYWDVDETNQFIDEYSSENLDFLVWFGENRVESLFDKELEREQTHFIWNIQTKQIKHIIKYCETIHSVDNVKHVKKLEEICEKADTWVKIFLQINMDETKEGGIKIEEIPKFMELIDTCDNISFVWFSAIWKAEFTREEKLAEFELLKELRKKYIVNGLISAWTSRDYDIAIEQEIDIIRVWKALVE